MVDEKENAALKAERKYKTAIEESYDYIENFDILETITNVGNDEVFTPRNTVEMMLNSLPEEVWHNPNYKWLNPASKNGVFEREIALRLDCGLEDVIPNLEKRRKHILQDMIYSIGLTKFTSNVTRRTLYYCSKANKKCDGIKAEDGHYVNGYSIGNGTWFDDEEGNVKTPNSEHFYVKGRDNIMPLDLEVEERKNYRCKFCGISGDSEYNRKNQREKYAYEFIHQTDQNILTHLQDRFFKGNKNMKFDIIIGNPPYQLADGGAQASARPIYHNFVLQSIALNPKYLCMIIPSRWMTGGKGLDDFRNKMIHDKHITLLHDFANPKTCFPNNDIKGGVCFFLWDLDYEGKCDIYRHGNKDTTTYSNRYLADGDDNLFIREPMLLSIKNKVSSVANGNYFENIVSSRKPYGLSGDVFYNPDKYNIPTMEEIPVNDGGGEYIVHGLDKHFKRTKRYVPLDYPIPKKDGLNYYKIFVTRNYGCGALGEVLSTPVLSTPGELCTETFVQIGKFKNVEERNNCYYYICTKFFRALVGVVKQDQNASREVYRFVPMQDFTNNSDINWSVEVKEIDKQLYKKYNLSDAEILFIEENVQEMK